jgi:hypothetical protein
MKVIDFSVGEKVRYVGKRAFTLNKYGDLCVIRTLDMMCEPNELPFQVVFQNNNGDAKYWVNLDEIEKVFNANSPTVGDLVVRGTSSVAQSISFIAPAPTLHEAYGVLHKVYEALHKGWDASYYRHVVMVQYVGNATFVTVMIDPHHPMTPETRPLRLFYGSAICNATDQFDALIGLRIALRDAMDVGKRDEWIRPEARDKIQIEEWSILRVMLKSLGALEQELYSKDIPIPYGPMWTDNER